MPILLSLAKKYRWRLAGSALAGIVSGLSSSGILAVIHWKLNGTGMENLPLPFLFVALVAGFFIFSFLAEFLNLTVAETELARLRYEFSKQILRLPLHRVEQVGSGTLYASMTQDLDKIIKLIVDLPSLFINGSIVLGCIGYITYFFPKLFGIIIGVIGLGYVVYMLPFRLTHGYINSARDAWSALCQHFNAITHGAKELKMHHKRRQSYLDERIRPTADSIRRNMIKGKTIHNLNYRWGDSLLMVGLGMVLFVFAPRFGFSQKDLTGFVIASLYIVSPLSATLQWGPNFQEIRISLANLQRIGISPTGDAADDPPQGKLTHGKPDSSALSLQGITHSYSSPFQDETFHLGPMDLSLERGELVFLTGGNGSGKTTLLKILCGLYTPSQGTLEWEGIPITDANRGAYRELFSVVFSDCYVFDSLFGLDADGLGQRTQEYLEMLRLDKKLTITQGRLSTVNLSQGQKKRLALLVALLEDRPFYVFDEWAADQDPEFKKVFYHAILPDLKQRNKGLLVISHDDSYYGKADRVLKLENGLIASNTTH